VLTIAPETGLMLDLGMEREEHTCHYIDHVPKIYIRGHINRPIVLSSIAADQCFKNPNSRAMHISRKKRNTQMCRLRDSLHLLNKPVTLFLQDVTL